MLFCFSINKSRRISKISGRAFINAVPASDAFDIPDADSADGFAHDVNRHRTRIIAFAAFHTGCVVRCYFLIGRDSEKAECCPQRAEITVSSAGKSNPEKQHHHQFSGKVFVCLDFRNNINITGCDESKQI